jgi:hypothetical protein
MSDTQPMLMDFGLDRYEARGKMVMWFEKEAHSQEKYGGRSVKWKKIR